MDFLKNGTEVTIMGTSMRGIIIGVCIRGIDIFTIEYEVQWISSDNIQSTWLYNFQVKEYIETRQPPGMVNYETGIVKHDNPTV